jgi:hypothetical protein
MHEAKVSTAVSLRPLPTLSVSAIYVNRSVELEFESSYYSITLMPVNDTSPSLTEQFVLFTSSLML